MIDRFLADETWISNLLLEIKKDFGWCDDTSSKYYNKFIKTSKNIKFEKLFRKNKNYDLLIPIKYNTTKPIKKKGSAIFLHISKKKYNPTKGCIAISKKDFLKILPTLNKKTKITIS